MNKIGVLHVVTDTVLQSRLSHVELARRGNAGGADTIQYRQKIGETREMIETATAMQAVCKNAGSLLIVNDRVDVALAANADGVHLGQYDFPVSKARELLGPEKVIGVSGGTLEEARLGIEDGADYVGFGPIYLTGSKADAGDAQGLSRLAEMVLALSVPVIAIGGISKETAADVIGAGAHGIAVISAVCCQPDPERATINLLTQIQMGKDQ